MATVLAVAWWKGDWRARLLASGQFAQFAINLAVCALAVCYVQGRPIETWRYLVQDVVFTLLCFAAVVGARRYWVIWTASIASVALVTDYLYICAGMTSYWAWASANIIWSDALFALILWGVWTEVESRRDAERAS